MALVSVLAAAEAVGEVVGAAVYELGLTAEALDLLGDEYIVEHSAVELGEASANTAGRVAAVAGTAYDPLGALSSYAMSRALGPRVMWHAGEIGEITGLGVAESFGAGDVGRSFARGIGKRVGQGVATQTALTGVKRGIKRARTGSTISKEVPVREVVHVLVTTLGQSYTIPVHTSVPLHRRKEIGLRYIQDQLDTMGRRPTFARTRKMTMKWATGVGEISLGSTTANGAEIVKANSLFNPGSVLGTADTHEPLGYLQMTPIYEKYVVSNSRIRVDYLVNEPTSSVAAGSIEAINIGLACLDNSTVLTAVGHYEELDDSVWLPVGPESTGRLYFKYDPTRVFGVPKGQLLSSDELKANSGADPANLAYFHIWAHHLDKAVVSPGCQVSMTIMVEYDVVWSEPTTITQS